MARILTGKLPKRFILGFGFCLLLLGLISPSGVGNAAAPYLNDDELAAEARRDFELNLDLWRDGRYQELSGRVVLSGSLTREAFSERLANAPLRPACCWEKIQEVRVSIRGDQLATLSARLGFEGPATTYKTKSFRLVKEDGLWRVAAADLLSLGETKRKKGKKSNKRSAASASRSQ